MHWYLRVGFRPPPFAGEDASEAATSRTPGPSSWRFDWSQADTIRLKVRFGRGPELRNGVVALGGQLSVGGR